MEPLEPNIPIAAELVDRIIPNATGFLAKHDPLFFQTMDQSTSQQKLRMRRTPIEELRGNMTIVSIRNAGAEATFDNMVPVEESLYQVLPADDNSAPAFTIVQVRTRGTLGSRIFVPDPYHPNRLF